jgi:hypothetical protein
MTVQELKEQLEKYNDDTEITCKALVIISNADFGYKYGDVLNLAIINDDLVLQVEIVS